MCGWVSHQTRASSAYLPGKQKVKRRTVLLLAAMLGAGKSVVACGGGGGESSSGGTTQPPGWDVTSVSLFINDANSTFDLSATLPPGTRSGGRFAVDANGAALPPGVTLSSSGLLSLAAGATPAQAQGVIFSYTEPA